MMRSLLIVLLLTGCASDRWLSQEEDAELRAQCEPNGCVFVPRDQWHGIEQLLRGFRI